MERVERLGRGDLARAGATFRLMAEVFGEGDGVLSDAYLERLLARDDFWAFAALADDEVIGGLTAHVLMMTRQEGLELMVYDIAVHPDHQRRGVGRNLVDELRRVGREADIDTVFVLADDDDAHALDFYRALGATATPVTMFDFT